MSLTYEDIRKETFLDIQNPEFFALYKTHQQSLWVSEEVSLANDKESFLQLTDDEQTFIKKISTFFLIADKIVIDTIDLISKELDFQEVKAFYAVQTLIEIVHIETYSRIFDALFENTNAQSAIDEITNMPSVIRKREFCLNIKQHPLPLVVVMNTFVEGIFFAASFSGIIWLKKRGKCIGISTANEWIAKDERLHWRFGCEIFKKFFASKVSREEIYDIIETMYQIEKEFIYDILKNDIGEMNKEILCSYVKFCCNEILSHMGIEPFFDNVVQPFEFMKFLDYPVKTNFFEGRVTSYSFLSTTEEFSYTKDNELTYEHL
jgi:ribonucleoside-diphosphate reductase beta chain